MPTNRFYLPAWQSFCASVIILVLLGTTSCKKENSIKSKIPSINFTGMSSDSIVAGSNEVINVYFNFADRDGDLGNTPSSGNYDIYTIDSRDTSSINYYFPQGLIDAIDPSQGVTGACTLGLEAAFILLRPDRPDRDTVQYEIYIKDRAGNESNHFTTPPIYITP